MGAELRTSPSNSVRTNRAIATCERPVGSMPRELVVVGLLGPAALEQPGEIQLASARIGELVRVEIAARWQAQLHLRLAEALVEQRAVSQASPPPPRFASLRTAEPCHPGDAGDERIAGHFERGGDKQRARAHCARAADEAASMLAFARAERLYRRALELLPSEGELSEELRLERRALRRALADQLWHLARCPESAELYVQVADESPPAEASALRLRAAEQYAISGWPQLAQPLLRELMREAGERLPSSTMGALAVFAYNQLRLWFHGRRLQVRDAEAIPPELLARFDLVSAANLALSQHEILLTLALRPRVLQLAYAAGEPSRLVRVLVIEACLLMTIGQLERAERIRAQARSLAEQLDDPLAWAHLHLAEHFHHTIATNVAESAAGGTGNTSPGIGSSTSPYTVVISPSMSMSVPPARRRPRGRHAGAHVSELLAKLPTFLGGHLRLTLIALGIGIALSLPLGVLATRVRWLERVVMIGASIVQTIPGLALLAVMVPLLAALSLPSIGALPALIGLTAYSVLPILRNTVTGIRGVDPALVEAARGVGMSEGQRLRQVELPLALPIIVAGVRTASVWVVGTATLSTPVGAPSLGNYIFSGLQTRNDAAVVLGCVAAAALALSLDALIRLLEWAVSERRKAARNLVLAVFGLGYAWVIAGPLWATWTAADREAAVIIGSKPFTEQYILAELLREQVEAETGLRAELMPSLGSKVAFDALVAGDIAVYVDYSGTLWTNYMHRQVGPARAQVLAELERWLADEHDVVLVGALGFENAYALAISAELARRHGLRSIPELAPHAARWTIVGDYEFFSRPEWARIREVYGLEFEATRSMDTALMYEAVRSGEVEVLSAYSTDGRIDAYGLELLADPGGAIPPYDAVILVNGEVARANPELVDALEGLVGRIDARRMRQANRAVDLDGESIQAAASQLRAWAELR